MKERIRKFMNEHEDAVFFISTIGIGVCVGTLVAWKVCDRNKIIAVEQYLDGDTTVGVGALFKNGTVHRFMHLANEM